MAIWLSLALPLFVAAITVKQDDTPLRSGGCDVDAPVVAKLSAATKVAVKFSLNGQSEPCYKVEVSLEGRTQSGYLPGTALDNRAEFDKATGIKALMTVKSAGETMAQLRCSVMAGARAHRDRPCNRHTSPPRR